MTYRKLTRLIRMIAVDNGIRCKEEASWKWPRNADYLESSLKKVSKEGLMTLAVGEHTEQMEMIKEFDLNAVNSFLERAFDGDLYDNFYIMP